MSEDSDTATRAVIAQMIAIARQSSTAPPVVSLAAEAAAGYDDDGEIAARIFWAVKNRIAFVEDEIIWSRCKLNRGVESEVLQDLLIAPADLLEMPRPVGDCDDFSMLVCSLLIACGIGCRLVVIAADESQPRTFSHVYVHAVLSDGRVIALDASHGPYPGWEAGGYFRREIYDVFQTSGGGLGIVSGGIDWNSILSNTIGSVSRIFEGRYGVPPSGTYITQGPGGSTVYRPNDSGTVFPPVVGSLQSSGGLNTTLLIGGLGLLVVVMLVAAKK